MSFTCTLFSDKVRCFNQSKHALYGNFVIIKSRFILAKTNWGVSCTWTSFSNVILKLSRLFQINALNDWTLCYEQCLISHCLHCVMKGLILSNYWMRLSRIWRILQIKEGVIHRGRRPRWITPSEICRILHILRKQNSIILLLYYPFKIIICLFWKQFCHFTLCFSAHQK